ncbi:ATP-binding protein [Spirulina sp. CS-785/01]|uniref:ATP-binding protein n=1 Tax=Spirulina sp. CS-785/01 TaxID=3021716 RepID=UPI00232DF1AC|nr:ATP-binding protein [Spirulina sp. CS-785/01]MDB9314904.1 ATP-binding protein [Spirulina sp. CS-785/01]
MTAHISINKQLETLLQNEAREAIHTPGCIQPYGVLLVLQEKSLDILQASENTQKILGVAAQDLVNRHLNCLFDAAQIEKLQNLLKAKELKPLNPVKLILNQPENPIPFDGIVHRSNQSVILELEPTSEESVPFLNFYHLVREAVLKLHQTESLPELAEVAAQEVRRITELDRVMIYQFDSAGNGIVIAEDKVDSLDSLRGLNYPASDIPPAAKELFAKNPLRLIPDINYQPARLYPQICPATDQPLDLGYAVLRSPSACHRQYLRNMGVRGSLTIPLTKEGQLWGLIAAHHHSGPKYFSYESRAACEFLGQAISAELTGKATYEDYDYQLELKSIQTHLLQGMSETEDFIQGLAKQERDLCDLVSARGAVLYLNHEIIPVGETPAIAEIEEIIQWLKQGQFQDKVFSTTQLSHYLPSAKSYKETASGLLAVAISETQQKYILWFRPEVIQTVNWAGNPQEGIDVDEEGQVQMSPRTSFELWKETVQHTALPWKSYEIQAAFDLRKSIINIVMRKADELAKLNNELNEALSSLKRMQTQLIQSEKMSSLGQMVAGVAHEINNPVNFIYGNLVHADRYTQDMLKLMELYQQHHPQTKPEIVELAEEMDLEFVMEDLPKLLNSMQVGADRIRGIVQSLRNFSRTDEAEQKAVSLEQGLESTLLILSNRLKEHADEPGIAVVKDYGDLPLVECYPSQLNQVFMNLLANALDALEERDRQRSRQEILAHPGQITIRTAVVNEAVEIAIADNGPGIPPQVQEKIFDPFFTTKPVGKGTGMGLAISYQIVTEKHHGELICTSQPGQGTEFIVTIPLNR